MDPGEAQERGPGTRPMSEIYAMPKTDGRERVRCWEGVAHRWGWRVLDGAKRRGGLDQV